MSTRAKSPKPKVARGRLMPTMLPVAQLAFKGPEAAAILGIKKSKFWELVALGKVTPTTYNTFAYTELQRHLDAEVLANKKK